MGHQTTLERPSPVYASPFARDERVSQESLPPPRSNHWVLRQKLAVVDAVNSGRLPLSEAMRRYELSLEEFLTWQDAFISENAIGPGSLKSLELVH